MIHASELPFSSCICACSQYGWTHETPEHGQRIQVREPSQMLSMNGLPPFPHLVRRAHCPRH